MTVHRHYVTSFIGLLIIVAIALSGCGKQDDASKTSDTSGRSKTPAPQAGGEHTDTAGHGGKVVELGSTTIGPFTVRASRDEGAITPGGDAPIDVWLTGSDAKVAAVRFWIGTERGEDFVKAKADIEDPSQPNHWHTHAEVPSPLPAGSKLWVEVEIEGQGKKVGSFDLMS